MPHISSELTPSRHAGVGLRALEARRVPCAAHVQLACRRQFSERNQLTNTTFLCVAREVPGSVMGVIDRPQNYINRIRSPAIQGLPRVTVHILHHSLTLVYLRQRVDDAKLQVDRSWEAVRESKNLLRRLHTEGF